jgi:glycerophosphoryl diester phosphodiesterase
LRRGRGRRAGAGAAPRLHREQGRRLSSPPRIIAHRGASAHALENTLSAFRLALEHGADGVELDVRLTADRRVVVFHDATLRRLAGRAERIDALGLAALRDVRLEGGETIPTLDEALEELRAAALVNVEIKARPGRGTALVDAVARDVARHAAGDRVLVSAFDPIAVAWARHRGLATAYLFHAEQARPLREAWLAPILRPDAVHPEHRLVDRARMAAWRRRGYAVNVWTVDDPAELRRLATLGVDGIFCDDPAAARAVLRQA